MEKAANLILFFLFIPASLRGLLIHTYWWQVKEYRLDRFLVFLKTKSGRLILTPFTWWAKLFLLFSLIFLTHGVARDLLVLSLTAFFFLIDDSIFLLEVLTRKLRRPVFTLRAWEIFLTGIFIEIVLLVFWRLWGLWSNLHSGAIFILVLDKILPLGLVLGIFWSQFLVERTKRREVQLAKEKLLSVPHLVSIGITGSYGKTSTKEFLSTILSWKFKTAKTTGSENTEFGIARKIQSFIHKDTEVFVAEMGAYKKGEIKRLCEIVSPRIGIITGISPQHLELFGSLGNLMEAKYELIESLGVNGLAIFNGENPYCLKMARQTKKIKKIICQIGRPKKEKANILWADKIVVKKEKVSFSVHWQGEQSRFEVLLLGRQFTENILLATAAALSLGMKLSEVRQAVSNISSVARTMEPQKAKSGAFLIDDTYNSNPAGFKAALNYLKEIKFRRYFIVTPGIIELGEESKKIHYKLGQIMGKMGAKVYLTSYDFHEAFSRGFSRHPGNLIFEKDVKKIGERLIEETGKNDVILLEGRVPEIIREKLR